MQVPTIATARLCLRPLAPDDWSAVYDYARLPEVQRFIPDGVTTEEESRDFVARNQGDQARAIAIERASEGRLIGHLMFHEWFAPQTYEIGWICHPAYQRRGYVTEAARAMVGYGFKTMDLHRIIATCQPENPASYRVMEKLGMRREGWFRQCIARPNGVWWDELFYAILRDEWSVAGGA